MTVIAIRDNVVAADRQASNDSQRWTVAKLWVPDGNGEIKPVERMAKASRVYAFTGDLGIVPGLIKWHLDGADPEKYPASQRTDDWARLIVATVDGVWGYEKHPFPVRYRDKYIAYGSGSDVALGAMYHGATAIQAVEATNHHLTCCGLGIDYVELIGKEIGHE